MVEQRHSIDMREPLSASKDRQVSFRWAMAIDQRLDALMDRAVASGERTTRRETLAALIMACDLSGDDLGNALRRLRTATVGEVILDAGPIANNVVSLRQHPPGPRTRR
jgi:hypothetical protein